MQKISSSKPHWLTRLSILTLLASCLGGAASAIAQTTPATTSDSVRIYEKAEQMPEFEGGQQGLSLFLYKNMKYPALALRNNIEGTVYVKCVIDETGRVKSVNWPVEKGLGYGCDEEAYRVAKELPRFTPGKHNGKPVAVYFTLPVKFEIK